MKYILFNICAILIISVIGCSRSNEDQDDFRAEILQTSWLSGNLSNGPIGHQGSLVLMVQKGSAEADIIHVANGEVVKIGSVMFDASKNTVLSSTATVIEGGMDVGFILSSTDNSLAKGIECNLGKVYRCSRALGPTTVTQKLFMLYRIDRVESDSDKWRLEHESSISSMLSATKQMPVEYIALKFK